MIPTSMKLFLFLVFSLFYFVMSSQDFVYEWSDAISKLEKETPYKIFPNMDSGYSVVKRIPGVKNSISIDILDSNNVLLYANNVEVPGDEIVNIYLVNGSVTLFAVIHNNEKKEDQLSAYTLNTKGELSRTTFIASLKSNGGYLAMFKVAVSSDGQKVGVLCEKPFMKEKHEGLVIKILDKDLQPILTKDYSYAIASMRRRFNVPLINNKGSFYILKRARIKTNNKYLLTLIKESGVEEHHDLKLRSMRIADVTGAFNKEGELIVSGFYADFKGFDFQGAFSIKYNESSLAVYRKEFMFLESLIKGLKSKKEISKFGNGLNNFHVKKLIVTPEGSSYLIAEHLSVTKTEKESVEERKGIAVIKFSNKGNFLWAAPIASNQIDNLSNGYWSSSVLIGSDTTLYVLYNPVGEGVKKSEDVYGVNALIGTRFCSVDVDGVVTDNPYVDLFKGTKEGVVMFAKAYYYSGKELIIVAENAAKDKLYLGNLSNK
jgi:hypothetical protein